MSIPYDWLRVKNFETKPDKASINNLMRGNTLVHYEILLDDLGLRQTKAMCLKKDRKDTLITPHETILCSPEEFQNFLNNPLVI